MKRLAKLRSNETSTTANSNKQQQQQQLQQDTNVKKSNNNNKKSTMLFNFLVLCFMLFIFLLYTSTFAIVKKESTVLKNSASASMNNNNKLRTPPVPASTSLTCPESTNPNFQRYVGSDWPQKLDIPSEIKSSAYPFVSHDIWAEVADQKRVFFLRPFDDYSPFPKMSDLMEWIEIQPHPVTILMSNNKARSFPEIEADKRKWYDFVTHRNVHAIYTMNPRHWNNINHLKKVNNNIINDINNKIKPLPNGLKWQFKSQRLYGEDKKELHHVYSQTSDSPHKSQSLFEMENRTDTVWLRPMMGRSASNKYEHTNKALKTQRKQLKPILERTLNKNYKSLAILEDRLNQTEYFKELQKHRFVISPVGVGLDSHGTWEALLAGTIPIVPHSPLDPMFENLPVWLVHDWEEVTEEAMLEKSREMRDKNKANEFQWEKVFVDGWKKEIYSELCKLPSDTK